MDGMDDGDGLPDGAADPAVSPGAAVDADTASRGSGPAPSEAFQRLASEVRVTVLLELLAAERAGETPVSFSALQSAADADTSAGFAYHLRQLSDHFVREREGGYVLTPAGQRAAEAVVDGTFTGGASAS